MSTDDLRELLRGCRKTGKAIPALNYSDIWDLTAIIRAAHKSRVPIMVSSNPLVAKCFGVELCQSFVDALRNEVDVSIFHHLDHSASPELCIAAIEAGYDSVMIDGSAQSLERNIELVRTVVGHARQSGVIVEAEIGRIKGKGVEGNVADDVDYLARVDEVVELVEKTGVDLVAVGIGTAHGFYQGEPRIHFDRLEEIAAEVETPLVLHGGTDISDADIRHGIRLGISKVNIGTIIHTTYMTALFDTLKRSGENPYTLDVMDEVLPAVERVVENRIQAVVGSD